MTNNEIYTIAEKLEENFANQQNSIYFPAKLNFYFLKNRENLFNASNAILKSRQEIAEHYGVPQGDGTYFVPEEKREAAGKELEDLFNLEQDIKIYKVKIDSFDNMNLSISQMDSLMFMIEEDE